MATRFGKFQLLSQRLITKNGRLITYRKPSSTPADPTKPWEGNGIDVDVKCVPAVFVEYNSRELTNELIQVGDKKVLIAKLDLPKTTPKTKDILVDGTTLWHVVNVNTLQPGNITETILFTLQVRS